MTTMRFIRAEIMGLTQKQMAEIAGVAQPTVCRWESGELSPSLAELNLIRAEAKRRRIKLDDKLFFAAPTSKQGAAA